MIQKCEKQGPGRGTVEFLIRSAVAGESVPGNVHAVMHQKDVMLGAIPKTRNVKICNSKC